MTPILCSWCKKDITTTHCDEDFRIALVNERIPHAGATVIDFANYPLLKENCRFCSLECLRGWVNDWRVKSLTALIRGAT